MNRRGFLIRVGGAMVAVPVAAKLAACGDDGGGDNADAAAATSFMISSTGSGHTHQLTIQCSALGGGDVTLTSTSAAGHTHQVTITAAQLTEVDGGGSVTVMTTDGGHDHSWTISRPSNAC